MSKTGPTDDRRQKTWPAGAGQACSSVQIVSVSRATVSARAVVAATRATTLATTPAATEGATVGPLWCLEQAPRLAGRDRHATGHARAGGGQQRVARSCPGRHDVHTGIASQSLHAAPLVRESQRDDTALLAGASRTARAVQVVLVISWRVGLQDNADVVHVDAARCDVRGDQNRQAAVLERTEYAVASTLSEATVQRGSED